MTRHLVARLAAAFTIATLLLGAFALPQRQRHRRSLSTTTASNVRARRIRTIQAAIDAADPGDVVRVCPGHYPEQVTIDKAIVVRAKPLFRAHIDVPAGIVPTNGVVAAVAITADHAVLRGFRIHIESGSVVPTIRPSALSCAHVDAAISVQGLDVRVRNNKIDATGDDTLSGACGYDYGIVVGLHSETGVRPSGEALLSATAKVTFNWVTDFRRGGILVEDEDSYAFVRRNTLRYLHANDGGSTCAAAGCAASRPSGINGFFEFSFGIGIESQARADVIRNAVYSGMDACIDLCGPASTEALNWGIALTALDGSETTTVYENSVYRTIGGIVTNSDADGANIHHNRVTTSHYGFQLGGDGDEIHHNRAVANAYGFAVAGSDNNIHDNDATGNSDTDCFDNTSGGTGTVGTHNEWTNNIGDTDNPDGICNPET